MYLTFHHEPEDDLAAWGTPADSRRGLPQASLGHVPGPGVETSRGCGR